MFSCWFKDVVGGIGHRKYILMVFFVFVFWPCTSFNVMEPICSIYLPLRYVDTISLVFQGPISINSNLPND